MALDTLGKRLKSAREKKGLKQNYVAKQIGVAPPTLSGYETDFREPDQETLRKLADVLEVDFNWLYGSASDVDAILQMLTSGEVISVSEFRKLVDEDRVTTNGGRPLSPNKKKLILALLDEFENE